MLVCALRFNDTVLSQTSFKGGRWFVRRIDVAGLILLCFSQGGSPPGMPRKL